MPVYQIDLIFQAGGYGWKETYYRELSSSITANLAAYTALAEKRVLLSAFPVDIEAVSVQDPLTAGRLGETFYFNPPKRPAVPATPDLNEDYSAAFTTSINVRWVNTANNLARRIWMRGIWDKAVVGGNALAGVGYAQWYTAWLQYRTYILDSSYGWLSNVAVDSSTASYTYVAAELTPTFTIGNPTFFPADQVGTYQRVRFAKINGSRSPLNTEMIVLVTARDVCKSAQPIAAGPMTSVGKISRYGTPTFVAATNLVVERVGRRAPGRPLLRTPGRSRARARS